MKATDYAVEFSVTLRSTRQLPAEVIAHDASDNTYHLDVNGNCFQLLLNGHHTKILNVYAGAAAMPFAKTIVNADAKTLIEAARLFREDIIGFAAPPSTQMIADRETYLDRRPAIDQDIEPTFVTI